MSTGSGLRGSDRVSIDKDVHQLYKDLTEKSSKHPKSVPFYLMKDVFMWAVALGVETSKRRKIKKGEQIFRWDQLTNDVDIPALRAIAIAETGDVEVIADEPQILRIAEEYANEGIRKLKSEIVDQPGQPLWNLVSIIRNE